MSRMQACARAMYAPTRSLTPPDASIARLPMTMSTWCCTKRWAGTEAAESSDVATSMCASAVACHWGPIESRYPIAEAASTLRAVGAARNGAREMGHALSAKVKV